MKLKLKTALKIVHEMAEHDELSYEDVGNERELQRERKKQQVALKQVSDFIGTL